MFSFVEKVAGFDIPVFNVIEVMAVVVIVFFF